MADKYLFFLGLAGSGKTYLTSLLSDLGFSTFHVRDLLEKHLKLSQRGDFKVIERMVRDNPSFVRDLIVNSNSSDARLLVIEGIKSPNDIRSIPYVQRRLCSIHCPRDVRLNRILHRNGDRDPITMEELEARDTRELSYGVRELIFSSDTRIENRWSHSAIQLVRLEEILECLDTDSSLRIRQYLDLQYGKDSIPRKRSEAKRNERRAMNENYWLREIE